MRRVVLLLSGWLLWAQNYFHPTTGQQNTYAGACQVHTCSGNYYDNGGPSGDYSNNINWIYWTFCPNQDGQCLRVQFSSFNVEQCGFFCGGCPVGGCYDVLRIQNGPAQNGPILWQGCGTSLPPTQTSTDASGCLTFRFCSDGSVTRPGWAATLSCVSCTRQPAGNSDCQQATPVCSNGSINDASYGPGNSAQCGGCITNENYTNFYIFQPQGASGNITLSICPSNGTDDYDFAIWGPFSTNNLSTICATLGSPVRCSYAATTSCTGMNNTATDNSEDVLGDGWVQRLNVTAGQYYILLINGWTAGSQGYNLTWGLPSGMSFNCTPLSQPVVAFRAELVRGEGVLLRWGWDAARLAPAERLTGWAIDRSGDGGQTWQTLAQLPVEITTCTDRTPFMGENLYRLRYGYEDGRTETYITSQRVEWSPAGGRPFDAWFKPEEKSLHIQLFDQGQGGRIELLTVDGRLIQSMAVESSPFLSAMGWVLSQPGVYIVRYGGQSIVVPALW